MGSPPLPFGGRPRRRCLEGREREQGASAAIWEPPQACGPGRPGEGGGLLAQRLRGRQRQESPEITEGTRCPDLPGFTQIPSWGSAWRRRCGTKPLCCFALLLGSSGGLGHTSGFLTWSVWGNFGVFLSRGVWEHFVAQTPRGRRCEEAAVMAFVASQRVVGQEAGSASPATLGEQKHQYIYQAR